MQGTTLPQAGLVMCIFRDMEDFGPGTPGVDFYGLPQLVAAGTSCEVFQLSGQTGCMSPNRHITRSISPVE